MNNFNALDLSECHSEEVMFLLTLSVLESQFWVEAGGRGVTYSQHDWLLTDV